MADESKKEGKIVKEIKLQAVPDYIEDIQFHKFVDSDACSSDEIDKLFPQLYYSEKDVSITKSHAYCQHLANDPQWSKVAVALSDGSIKILERGNLEVDSTIEAHSKNLTGLIFSPENGNLICSSSGDGFVKLFDLRADRFVKEYSHSEEGGEKKPFLCVDLSSNERVVCAGSELMGEDSFLMFWDLRGDKLLGGYWESHSDDIIQVKFNPKKPDTLASASTDGLINIFDISKPCEDDALTYCLSADVAVDKLRWTQTGGVVRNITALTDINSLQYWDIEEVAPMFNLKRETITSAMKRNYKEECYLVDVVDEGLKDHSLILVGSGLESEPNWCLRTLRFNKEKGTLHPHGALVKSAKWQVVRACLYHKATEMFLTAGEEGIISVWSTNMKELPKVINDLKITGKHKSKRSRPY
ncbi:WD repeat-containing protein 89 [Oratosquilla oratoria]|uniref:WD repeat-containing protein 89 n=1 Tax=Oratosquilla oratoria TaxID=337810 RepID=UPI003F75A55E